MANHPRPAYNMLTNPNPSTSTSSAANPTNNTDDLRPPPTLRPLPPALPRGERPVGRLQPPSSSYLHHRSAQLHSHSPYTSIRSTPVSRPRSNSNSRPGSRPGSRPSSKPTSRSNSPPPGSNKARFQERIRERQRFNSDQQVGDTTTEEEVTSEVIMVEEDDSSFGSGSAMRFGGSQRSNTVHWSDSPARGAQGNTISSSTNKSSAPNLLPPTNPESAISRRRVLFSQMATQTGGYSQSSNSRTHKPSVWSRTASMPVSPPNERAEESPRPGAQTPSIDIEVGSTLNTDDINDKNGVQNSSSLPFPRSSQQQKTNFNVNGRLYTQQQPPQPSHRNRFGSVEGRRVGYRSSISSLRQSRAMLLEAARRTVDDESHESFDPYEQQHYPQLQSTARSALEASVRNLERTLHDTGGSNNTGGFRRTTYASGASTGISPSTSIRRPREENENNTPGRWSRPTSSRFFTRNERANDQREDIKDRRKNETGNNKASSTTELTAAQLWAKRKAELSAKNNN